MNYFSRLVFLIGFLLAGGEVRAQQPQELVRFQVTYDLATDRYTAWVVPNYTTADLQSGATAQFTIKVPASFIITELQDAVDGFGWQSKPLRLGPGNPGQDWSGADLDPNINFYIIGKSPTKADYGNYVAGRPIALFYFRGNGCFGSVSPLEPGHPFIAKADEYYSFNVSCSFYSGSVTPGGAQTAHEQFAGVEGSAAQCTVMEALADSQTLTAGSSTTLNVLANDTRNGQPISSSAVVVSVTGSPATGGADVNTDGSITYTPGAGFSGPVSLTYAVCDAGQPEACAEAVVSLTVDAVVMALDDAVTTPSGSSVTALVLANDLRNGLPVSSSAVSLSLLAGPALGGAVITAGGGIVYTPVVGYSGPASLTYAICDLEQPAVCDTATLSLNVLTVIAAGADSQTLTAGSSITLNVLANDTRNGQPISSSAMVVSITGSPATVGAGVNTDGNITYTPAEGFSGPVSLTYTVCDAGQAEACAVAVVSLTVNAVLAAVADLITTPSGSSVTALVLVNDTRNGLPASGSAVAMRILAGPAMGTASVVADGAIVYTPPVGYSGPASLTYTLCDLNQPTGCSTASLSIRVLMVIEALADSQTLTAGSSITLNVLANDTRNGQPISSSAVSVRISGNPATGTVSLSANGSITYTPAEGFSGPVSFSYTVCDRAETSVCASTPVRMTVVERILTTADLLLTSRVSRPASATDTVVSLTLTLTNNGPENAVGVMVTDTLVRNRLAKALKNAPPSKGTFDPATGVWTVGDLALNETVTLVLFVNRPSENEVISRAVVIAAGSKDPDRTNDFASACTAAPLLLCPGEVVLASVPENYEDVRWYRNGATTPVATGNAITITELGTYTVKTSNGPCPASGCCPVVVEEGDCCKFVKCIPFTLKKTVSRY